MSNIAAISAASGQAARANALDAALNPATRAGTARNSPTDIKKAAGQFEAIILRQLLAPSIEPMMSGGLGGAKGTGGGVFGYMLTDVLADSLSKGGGLGLSKMLSQQLTPRGAPVSAENEAASSTPALSSNNP